MGNDLNALNSFYEAVGLPLCVFAPDGSGLLSCPEGYASWCEEAYVTPFLALCRARGKNGPVILTPDESAYVGVLCTGEWTLLLGPAGPLRAEPRPDALGYIREAHRADYARVQRMTPRMPYRRLASALAVCARLLCGREISIESVVLDSSESQPFSAEPPMARNVVSRREEPAPHTPYAFETEMLSAVTAGDAARLRRVLLSPVPGAVGAMAQNSVTQDRYTFIAMSTLITRAAVAGGMPYEEACSLSDAYCRRMDALIAAQDINALCYRMAGDFADKVAAIAGLPEASKPVRVCCRYISEHLHAPIRLSDLAAESGYCTRHISVLFHRETGVTVSAYIRRARLREAKQLLRHTEYSIPEIAGFLQFSSQSHFTKVFRAYSGVTPLRYRNGNEAGN